MATAVPTELGDSEATAVFIISNGADATACKVDNKLADVLEAQDLTVNSVTPQDEESIKKAEATTGRKNLWQLVVIVATDELFTFHEFYDRLMKKFLQISGIKILIIKVGMEKDLPAELATYKAIDYGSETDFSHEATSIIAGWFKSGVSGDANSTYMMKINIEVRQKKSQKKSHKIKDKPREIRKIRNTVHSLLEDEIPGDMLNPELRKLFANQYKVNITLVSMNPLSIEGTLKGGKHWRKLEKDCSDQSLADNAMNLVMKNLKRSQMPFYLKLVLHNVAEVSHDDSIQQSVVQVQNHRSKVISKIVFNAIEKKDYTAYDFAALLSKYNNEVDLASLYEEDNKYNILHAVCVHNRTEFFIILVHLKLWRPLMQATVPVDSPSAYRGHNATQIADMKKPKKVKNQLTKHDQLVNGMGRFLKACHDGDRQKVDQRLHENPQVIHERDNMKNNCLYWCIVADNLELFMYLVDQRAEFDNTNEYGENLLHVACRLGRYSFVYTLLFKCANDVLATCTDKKTPVERVAENGDLTNLKELLRCDVKIAQSILPLAAENKRFTFVKYLLEESELHLDVNQIDKDGLTALLKCCDNGSNDMFNYLLGKGAHVSVVDKRRRGPLHYAAKSGDLDLVRTLVSLGADINAQDVYTGSELCFLIRGKDKGRYAYHYTEVRRNVVHTFKEKTKSGQVDVAKYGLVIKSGWGQDPTPGVEQWIKKMYSDRAKRANAPGDMTPLQCAIYWKHRQVAAFLIVSGADVNIKDLFGLTPLMYCAITNDIATATLLATKGAKFDERDVESKTALDIARDNEHSEMVNYIEGISYVDPIQRFVCGALEPCMTALSADEMGRLRERGRDVRHATIQQLRTLMAEVNRALVDLNASPIMKPSEDMEQDAGDSGLGAV